MQKLPDGLYPFIDGKMALADMDMIEAPRALEDLLKSQAAANGTEILRDVPVELTCRSDAFPEATFLVWYPSGQERIHILVPKQFAKGKA